jgi:hypothetical protein
MWVFWCASRGSPRADGAWHKADARRLSPQTCAAADVLGLGWPRPCPRPAAAAQGLYGERVGALTVVARDAAIAKRVESQLKLVRRAAPARGGAGAGVGATAHRWKGPHACAFCLPGPPRQVSASYLWCCPGVRPNPVWRRECDVLSAHCLPGVHVSRRTLKSPWRVD